MFRKITGFAKSCEEALLEKEYLALRHEVLKYTDPLTLDRIILEKFKEVYKSITNGKIIKYKKKQIK